MGLSDSVRNCPNVHALCVSHTSASSRLLNRPLDTMARLTSPTDHSDAASVSTDTASVDQELHAVLRESLEQYPARRTPLDLQRKRLLLRSPHLEGRGGHVPARAERRIFRPRRYRTRGTTPACRRQQRGLLSGAASDSQPLRRISSSHQEIWLRWS